MNIKKQIKLRLRWVRLERFFGSLFYSIQRDWLDRQFRNSQPVELFKEPGKVQRIEPTQRGANFYFEQAELEVCFLTSDLVRIDWKPGKPPVPYAIVREDWQEVEITLDKGSENTVISSSSLKIIIVADGSIEFQDANGQTLRQELPPKRQNEAWLHRAKLREEEQIYGLGERAAPLNLRSQPSKAYKMWNYDAGGIYAPGTDPLYLCIPVYIGLHSWGSYLIFYENTYYATFTFLDEASAIFEGGALRYYFSSGTLPQLVERYTELTGRPPLPPRWVFGYHQSRWGYETEEEVRKTVKGFETHNLPLSAIHLDIDCKDNFLSFTIDPDRFPKIADFNQELAAKGVRLVTITNPGIKADAKNKLFQEGKAQEAFSQLPNGKPALGAVWPGMCAFADFTNPLARHWWSRQYQYLLDLGVTGFWHDMNEPGIFTLWGDATLPLATKHTLEGRGGNHLEAHNLYGFLQARAGYEALCEYHPDRRPFIVSRAGWAGLQRYAWTWTGDIITSWEGMRMTVATVLGMGLSGIPYTGPDIGGFKGNPSAELYLRWFQMASFLPFCRTHSANNVKLRRPWDYGEEVLNIVRDFLQLRYRLIPYFYTLAWEATQTGHSPIRPLFWFDSQDSRLWGVDDQFFLGDALLVCPVGEQGARERQVILPKGHWYNFWNDAVISGDKQINLAAPLEQIPLLIRAGSILPMEVKEKLILHLYPPVEGSKEEPFMQKDLVINSQDSNKNASPVKGCVYSDAGDGYGDWRVDKFYMMRDQNTLELSWEEQGNYPFSYTSVEIHIHAFEPQQVWVDGKEFPCQSRLFECDRFKIIRFQGNFVAIAS